jgi:hypothetical protein
METFFATVPQEPLTDTFDGAASDGLHLPLRLRYQLVDHYNQQQNNTRQTHAFKIVSLPSQEATSFSSSVSGLFCIIKVGLIDQNPSLARVGGRLKCQIRRQRASRAVWKECLGRMCQRRYDSFS